MEQTSLTLTGTVGKITGVYSPVGRGQKTSFALALAYQYSKIEKTLYLNLEDFSGLTKLFGVDNGTDISDCLYFFRERREETGIRISAAAIEWEGFSVIRPAQYPADIRAMDKSDWTDWLSLVSTQAGYGRIVVDIGHGVCGVEDILAICDKIYMPTRSDWMSQWKKELFMQFLERAGKGELIKNIHEMVLPSGFPSSQENFSRYLKYGDLANIATGVCKEELAC
jgi:cellulose biosynthesis protein BcsQ